MRACKSEGKQSSSGLLAVTKIASGVSDTKYAFDETKANNLNAEELAASINDEAPLFILTGGEPLIQPHEELEELAELLRDRHNAEVSVETNGTILPSKELVKAIDFWSVSPKLSSSGCTPFTAERLNDWIKLSRENNIQIKFVIQNKEDVHELGRMIQDLPYKTDWDLMVALEHVEWVLQPEASNATNIYSKLPGWVKRFVPSLLPYACYIPQIHRIMNIK